MSTASVIRFLLLATLWGSSFTFIKLSLEGLTPSQLVLARLLLGAAVLLGLAGMRRVGLPCGAGLWGHLAVAALLGNVVPFLLLSYGELTTGAGIAGVIVGSTPLLTLALATVALPTERATARKVVGVLIGFLGVVLVIVPWGESLGGALAAGLVVSFGEGGRRHEHGQMLGDDRAVGVADGEVDPAEPAAVDGAGPPLEQPGHPSGRDEKPAWRWVGDRAG
jgi:drug/metabolite transporter (DMT)-like permease